ncbi:MAG: thioredoxin domain-containing protein [Myxococcota bacterium]|nr:thioredoxin domain-containing protein [Myxococcota bacterium]
MSDVENFETPDASSNKNNIWLYILVPILMFGVGVGMLMTSHHEEQLYGGEQTQLVGCEASAEVNCDVVNTSSYSEFLSVPIATWGAATYLTLLLCLFWVLQGKREYLKGMFWIGVLSAVYSGFLFYISKVEIGYVCLWCMRLYAVNLAIPILTALAGALNATISKTAIQRLALSFFIFAGVSILGQQSYRSSLLGDAGKIDLDKKIAENQEASESEIPKKEEIFTDPEGAAPALSFTIQTEDKNEAILKTSPDDPWKGNPNAKIAIIEFADLECGYCKRAASQLSKLYEAYKNDIVVIFKHYPLDPRCNPGVKNRKHRKACDASLAATCAQEQRRFWAFHDLTFKNQHAIEKENLRLYAEKVGMDLKQYDDCMSTGRTKRKLLADTKQGKDLDIHGTPRIWINDKLYRSGSSAQQMALFIERTLGKDAKEAAKNSFKLRPERSQAKPIPEDIAPTQTISMSELAFEIQTFEAGLKDGVAVSGKHVIPATRMSWFAAKDACEKANMRLCTEQEWLSACQGAYAQDDDSDASFADDLVEGTSYPYGDFYNPNLCWTAKDRSKFRPVYTGEMPGCVTPQGVYDLAGNVEEWVGDTPENAVLMGGAYDTPKEKARCYRANNTFGPGYSNKRTGFRCCK